RRLARAPDVGAGPVARDERDDRAIGNLEPAVSAADRVAWGNGHDGERGHADGQTGKPRAVQARGRRVRTRPPAGLSAARRLAASRSARRRTDGTAPRRPRARSPPGWASSPNPPARRSTSSGGPPPRA